ncbi:MAG: putative immunity protein [Thermotogota bacterium]
MTGTRSTRDQDDATLRRHKTEALRSAGYAEQVLPLFELQFPLDDRPRRAIEAARAWARGEIGVAEARAAALAAHAAARDVARSGAACTPADRAGCAAARAAGHAAATAHAIGHARAVAHYADKARAADRGDDVRLSAYGRAG